MSNNTPNLKNHPTDIIYHDIEQVYLKFYNPTHSLETKYKSFYSSENKFLIECDIKSSGRL